MPKDFVSQVYQDRADNDSMRATLELVYQDPRFDQLTEPTIAAVSSYFQLEAAPSQALLDLEDDKPLQRPPCNAAWGWLRKDASKCRIEHDGQQCGCALGQCLNGHIF